MDTTVDSHSHSGHPHHGAAAVSRSWRDYLPLLVLVVVSALVAVAIYHSYGPGMNPVRAMHAFMGFFLVVFALLKLFDLPGFADGFQMYDLLAKRSRAYAFAYPFLELALGLSYLAFSRPDVVYLATVILMGLGAIGVITALRKGLNVRCACMGTALKVPLSTVALVEDLGMATMALIMWMRLQF
jgi:hypothetical protein